VRKQIRTAQHDGDIRLRLTNHRWITAQWAWPEMWLVGAWSALGHVTVSTNHSERSKLPLAHYSLKRR